MVWPSLITFNSCQYLVIYVIGYFWQSYMMYFKTRRLHHLQCDGLVVWLNVPNRYGLHEDSCSIQSMDVLQRLWSAFADKGVSILPKKVTVQTGQLSFLECLLRVTRRAASRGCWDESMDRYRHKKSHMVSFVGEWWPLQDYTKWWASPLHLMWIKPPPPPIPCLHYHPIELQSR